MPRTAGNSLYIAEKIKVYSAVHIWQREDVMVMRNKRWAAALLAGAVCMSCMGTGAAAEAVSEQANEETMTEDAAAEVQTETAIYDGTWNLLLIGSDRRDSSWNGNSDTMILLTVNPAKKTTYMVSFMRDTAAAIPGYGTQKLNAAYATGGSDLLKETLESNFGVHIDNYAAVDFHSIVDIIDELGGVDIEQTSAEIEVANGYVRSICNDWGLDLGTYWIQEGQTHLNGVQALAYMRNRYVGNDYERTARQRNVLTSLLDQNDLTDPEALVRLLKTLMTHLDTDISLLDILSQTETLTSLMEYEVVTDRIPYDDLISYSGEMLIPSQPSTNDRLLSEIYGQ